MIDRTCTVCGSRYMARRSTSKYCSLRCVSRAQEQRRGPRPPRTHTRPCQLCGIAIIGPSARKRWCSPLCRYIAAGHPTTTPIPWGECAWCGKVIIQRGRRLYCSTFCLDTQHPYRSKASPIEYGDCQRCGGCFVRRAGKLGDYCSERCAKATRKRNRRHIERSRSVTGDRITLKGLGDRDGWRCHICKRTVTTTPGNLDTSPSMDHLVPLSAGGEHAWTNVALAHRWCNTRRGTTGLAQLRLIA